MALSTAELDTVPFLEVFVTAGAGGLERPLGLAFGPDNDLLVANAAFDQVLRYDGATGDFISVFVSADLGGLDTPTGLIFVSGLNVGNPLYFTQYGNGSGFTSTVMLNNASETRTATGSVVIFDDDGNPLPNQLLPAINGAGTVLLGIGEGQFSIPPMSSEVLMTDGQGDLSAGSVKITSNLPLNGNIEFSIPKVGMAGVAASPPLTGFMATVRNTPGGIRSGLALQNIGNDPITITLRLRSGGEDVPNGTVNVQTPGMRTHRVFCRGTFSGCRTGRFYGDHHRRERKGQIHRRRHGF